MRLMWKMSILQRRSLRSWPCLFYTLIAPVHICWKKTKLTTKELDINKIVEYDDENRLLFGGTTSREFRLFINSPSRRLPDGSVARYEQGGFGLGVWLHQWLKALILKCETSSIVMAESIIYCQLILLLIDSYPNFDQWLIASRISTRECRDLEPRAQPPPV